MPVELCLLGELYSDSSIVQFLYRVSLDFSHVRNSNFYITDQAHLQIWLAYYTQGEPTLFSVVSR